MSIYEKLQTKKKYYRQFTSKKLKTIIDICEQKEEEIYEVLFGNSDCNFGRKKMQEWLSAMLSTSSDLSTLIALRTLQTQLYFKETESAEARKVLEDGAESMFQTIQKTIQDENAPEIIRKRFQTFLSRIFKKQVSDIDYVQLLESLKNRDEKTITQLLSASKEALASEGFLAEPFFVDLVNKAIEKNPEIVKRIGDKYIGAELFGRELGAGKQGSTDVKITIGDIEFGVSLKLQRTVSGFSGQNTWGGFMFKKTEGSFSRDNKTVNDIVEYLGNSVPGSDLFYIRDGKFLQELRYLLTNMRTTRTSFIRGNKNKIYTEVYEIAYLKRLIFSVFGEGSSGDTIDLDVLPIFLVSGDQFIASAEIARYLFKKVGSHTLTGNTWTLPDIYPGGIIKQKKEVLKAALQKRKEGGDFVDPQDGLYYRLLTEDEAAINLFKSLYNNTSLACKVQYKAILSSVKRSGL